MHTDITILYEIKVWGPTFDAKLGVSSKPENNQHEQETSEGDSSNAHHHVHLQSTEKAVMTLMEPRW